MVSVSVKIDPKSFEEFQRAVEEFAKQLGRDFQDTAIQQGALLCTDAITFTPPMLAGGGGGASNTAKKLGESAISADIKSFSVGANSRTAGFLMYRKLGDAAFRNDRSYFDRVINNSTNVLKTVKNSIMVKIANDPDHERAFKKARNLFAKNAPQTVDGGIYDKFYDNIQPIHNALLKRFDGRRIRKKFGKGMGWINKYITTDKSVIDNEIKRSMMSVGKIKAGWSKAKQRLPKMKGRQIKFPGGKDPGWITRHGAPNGICNFTLTDKVVNLSVVNLIGNNNNVASEASTKNIVYGKRIKTLTQELQKALEAQAAKFNKK